ncbi:Ig-like domain-containing protein, partial [Aphanizomenon sp. 202]|nr:Ig-like domain-containing protein [Aphanizomenon sp. 202]
QTTQDSLFEGNETFTVSLSNPNNGAVVSSTNATAKGTINNDDAAPIFSIAAASATEGSAVNFTVTRTGDAQANQNVTIATSIGVGDTASGSDFTTKTETLTFAQGEASKTFTVQTTQDALLEVNETFTVSLSNPTNGAIISSTSGTAKGTIEDSIIKITANTQDGPIVGANVFFDGNFNGIKDGDEPQTTTDSTGNFTLEIIGSYDLNKNGRLDPTEGYYVATGGKDAITGLPFTGNLRAVAGSTVVTPITTLVSSIVDTGVSLEKASTQVKTALGIPDSVDLGTFNPIATENLGSSEAQKVLTAQVGVQAFIGQITTAFASVTNIDRITLGNQVTSNLATAVQSMNFNLSDVNQVKSLITNTVNSLKVLDNNLDLAKITTNTEQISQIVSANSQQILTATSISTVFKAQKVAQSDTTQDITAALKGEKSFQDVVARNTGEALKELIAQATIETLVNLEVTPSTVTEDGISNLVYTFTRIGDTANTLTVNYDITGTANSSDYTGAIPGTGKTITFAAGSSKATLTVDPTPDTIIEDDETVVLTLATGTGYTAGTSTAVTGTISNINKPPIITSGITFSVLDNTTTVGTVTATDPENQSLTYNLIGGVDQNLFTINATTGALRFKTAPDFKAPSDVGKDNVYDIKVQVTDGSNLVTQDIAIRVVTGMPAPINQAPTNITLQNSITTLSEGTSTTTRLKVADIVITDDGLGSNTISLTGVDATSFEVEETVLYIKKDTKLDYETKNSYGVTVNVDDTTVGNTPDVFTNFTLTVTDVNYAPEVKPNQIFGYTENKTANFQVGTVLATDDIAVTGFAIASGNDSGFFNINNQGIITLTDKGVTSAANDFERSPNSFTLGIIAKDAAEATSQVTNVTINVTNDPTDDNKKPNLQSFTQNGQEDQIISFGIGDFKDKGKYQDEDNNDLMAIKVISLPTAGSLTFVDGQQVTVNQEISVDDLANLRYNPVLNANGNVATLTVAAIDNGTPKVESDPATITINLTPVNDPPVAQNDQLSVSQGSAGTINPLNNDSDPEGDSLKLTGKTDGKYGKVDINGNNLTYTLSDANYLGNDVFSYTVSDGSLSASANVRVTVTGKAATDTVAPTQLIPIAPDDKLIPKEAGTLTGIVDKLGYEFPNNYNPSLVKNSLQNALNQTTAAFNNLFGLYEVDDATGSVNGIKPGETGYAKAALGKVVNNFIARVGGSSSGAASDVVVSGGKIYSPFVIANGGNFSGNLQQAINAFFAANPNNSPATAQNYTTLPVAYFSFGVANPDGAAHLRSFGNNTFGFEDLPAGVGISDYDFNDAVFSFGAIA